MDICGEKMKKLSWQELLSTKSLIQRTTAEGQSERDEYDGRTPFDSDYDRIIFSYPFRRLQDKAQLFPLESNDFVRTRLTHSLEVAALAKSLGISIVKQIEKEMKDRYNWKDAYEPTANIPKILECAGLVHDLGNPPFGHYGEETIGNTLISVFDSLKDKSDVFKSINLTDQQYTDIKNFEGNSQSFRILTHLQCIKDEYGYHMTSALLASIVKYPVSSVEGNKKDNEDVRLHKFGYFYPESETMKKVFDNTGLIDEDGSYIRHPLAFLMEAADDMAYCAGDIEDGFKKHLFSINELITFFEDYSKSNHDIKIDELKKAIEQININTSYYSEEKKIQAIRIKLQQEMFHAIIKAFIDNYEKIMEGSFKKELIEVSEAYRLRICLKEITNKYLFSNKEVISKEIMGKKVISALVKLYAEGLFNVYKNENKKCLKFDKRIKELISSDYLEVLKKQISCNDEFNNIEINSNNIYYILLLIADQIAGMTDTYCLSLFRKLNAI